MNDRTIIFCLLAGLISNSYAEPLNKSNELNKIRADIGNAERAYQQLLLKKTALQEQLANIEKRYGATTALLRTLQIQINQKMQSLQSIQQDIRRNREEINLQNRELTAQVRAAYAMGKQEKLKLLLNQQDPSAASRMMVYYEYINTARLKKIAEVETAVKELAQLDRQKRVETEQLQTALEKKRTERLALNNIRGQRNSLLVQLTADFSSNKQQLGRLKEDEHKLSHLVTSLKEEKNALLVENPVALNLNKDFSELKNKLTWPVKGKLAKKFGSAKPGGVWDGVLIAANEGQNIHAVANGKVVFADWLRGYGLLIIIDHGKGYMTLYAFNQSLLKQTGATVAAGETIAYVGQSGGRSQSGLYFGIRKQGEAVDPALWCRK